MKKVNYQYLYEYISNQGIEINSLIDNLELIMEDLLLKKGLKMEKIKFNEYLIETRD